MPAHENIQIVSIPATDGVRLEAQLALPETPSGVVVFAHGSGSSRRSPRNRYVAQSLRADAGVATLLLDLLSEAEEEDGLRTAGLRFDIGLLADRVEAATVWLRDEPLTRTLPIGYFGASTGAAAALVAASRGTKGVAAIVSRGGRPDLAGAEALRRVRAPTLLIVGGEDLPVIDMNREALTHLRVESRLEIVANASHLFEEPGALEDVARRAAAWFSRHLRPELPARSQPTAQ